MPVFFIQKFKKKWKNRKEKRIMEKRMEKVIVNLMDYSIHDYLAEGETILELMERTLQSREDRIHHLREACACFPENLHLQASLQEALNSRYQIMSLEEYLDRQREYILSGTPKEITEEEWDHMLSVLPLKLNP